MQNSNRKRIIFIQPGFAHYRYKLFDLLHKNHDVIFIFIRNMSIYPSSVSPNSEWNMFFLNGANNRFWFLKLIKLLIELRPQVIITSINSSYQSIISIIMGRLFKIPTILWSLSWDTSRFLTNRPRWKVFQHDMRVQWSTKNANAIVVAGNRAKKFNKQIATKETPIFIAYQSTEDHANKGENRIYSKEKYNEGLVLLYFARIVEYKGLDILIHAFSEIEKKYPCTNLLIAGDGPFRNFCEKLSKTLQLKNIHFYGSIQNENAWKMYKKADIFILPCSGRKGTEAWGLVINEAASMGLPIITTDAVGAAGDLVKDGVNGAVVKAGSVDQLQYAIERLIKDRNKLKLMGKESRSLFESINNYQKMYNGFNKAINSVNSKK